MHQVPTAIASFRLLMKTKTDGNLSCLTRTAMKAKNSQQFLKGKTIPFRFNNQLKTALISGKVLIKAARTRSTGGQDVGVNRAIVLIAFAHPFWHEAFSSIGRQNPTGGVAKSARHAAGTPI